MNVIRKGVIFAKGALSGDVRTLTSAYLHDGSILPVTLVVVIVVVIISVAMTAIYMGRPVPPMHLVKRMRKCSG